MPEISIDTKLCKKDGLCAVACMHGIFQQEKKNTNPKIVDPVFCYGCGQCLAICPNGAILHSDVPKDLVTPIKSENLPAHNQAMELIRSRRSKRLFKETKVESNLHRFSKYHIRNFLGY